MLFHSQDGSVGALDPGAVDSIYITPLTAFGITAIRQVTSEFDPIRPTSIEFIRIPQTFEANPALQILQPWKCVGDLLTLLSMFSTCSSNLTWQAAAQPLQLLGGISVCKWVTSVVEGLC